MIDLFVLQR